MSCQSDRKVDATSLPEPAQLIARAKELLQVTSYASAAKRRDSVDSAHLASGLAATISRFACSIHMLVYRVRVRASAI